MQVRVPALLFAALLVPAGARAQHRTANALPEIGWFSKNARRCVSPSDETSLHC